MLSNQQILDQFERDFARCKGQLTRVHADYKADKEFFLLDKQWSEEEQKARNPVGQPPRPTLTVNRMRQFLMQVINDHKQSRMGIRVTPGGGEEDKDLATVRQGIVRAIERNNGGQAAYGQAKTDQVAGGFGAWRLYADYISPTSHEQEPKYLPIWDGSKLYWPIKDCIEADYSDMDCAIVQEDWSESKFKAKGYGDPSQFLGPDKNPTGAWGGGGPTVSEYYFKREIRETLVKGIDGEGHFLSDMEKEAEAQGLPVDMLCATDDEGERIERESSRCEVWWVKLAGKRILSKPIKLPGQYIPVFIANGRKVVVDGDVHLWSLGRPAKDTQRSHNYAASAEMERLALSPKAPFVVAEGSIDPLEKSKWATLNTGNHPYVKFHAYHPQTKQPLPPPKRTDPIQSDPGFLNLKASTIDEMKAVLGMYDPSLGKQGNAVSGVAINAQTRQGDNATYDFADNMGIAMRHCGRVMNEWIPAYIDTARQVLMVGEDDREKVIKVNQEAQGEEGPYAYYMDKGRFNIDIAMGPSAATKRQETVESMKEFYNAYPPAAAVTGHLFAKEQDWRYSDEFSKILKKLAATQFPGVIEPEGGDNGQQPPLPPQAQQAMQQMQQTIQQQAQQLEQAQKALTENQQLKIQNASIQADKSLDAERVRIEWFKAQADAKAKGVDGQVKAAGMHLKADQQQHDQQIDNAELVHAVHQDREASGIQQEQHAHTINKDNASIALQAHQQGHSQQQDREKLGLEGRKLDQAKTAGPTGGKPGKPPQGRKA